MRRCTGIAPMDVVDLLNRLYCVMDFLAEKFQIYKGEFKIADHSGLMVKYFSDPFCAFSS